MKRLVFGSTNPTPFLGVLNLTGPMIDQLLNRSRVAKHAARKDSGFVALQYIDTAVSILLPSNDLIATAVNGTYLAIDDDTDSCGEFVEQMGYERPNVIMLVNGDSFWFTSIVFGRNGVSFVFWSPQMPLSVIGEAAQLVS